MATQATADYFAQKFNRLVGRHTGRPVTSRPGSSVKKTSYNLGPRVAQSIKMGTSKTSADAKRSHRAINEPRRSNYGGDATAMYTTALTRKNAELDSVASRNEEIQKTFEEMVQTDDNFQNSIAGRILDIISRPSYMVNEGLRAAREAENEGNLSEGEQWGRTLSGLWAGLSGRKKTGFGEYVEEFKEGDSLIGNALNTLEEEHPAISTWTQRGLGLAGELALDPLNAIGGGSISVARQSGAKLTTEAVQEIAERAARNSVDEVFQGRNLPPLNAASGRKAPGLQVISERVAAQARESTDRTALNILGGPNRGKLNLGRHVYAPTVANSVADNVRGSLLGNFEEKYTKFINAATGKGPSLTPRQVRNYISYDPNFRKFWDETLIEFNKTRPKHPVRTVDEAISALSKQSPTHVQDVFSRAAQTVRNSVNPDVQGVFDRVAKELTDFYYNAPSLRIAGTEIPLRPIGRAYSVLRGKVGARFSDDIANMVSYGHQFPGRLSQIGQTVRSRGVRAFDRERKEIRELYHGITNEEARTIQRALEENTPLMNPKLENVRLELQQRYKRLFADERASGSRGRNGEGLRLADDYAYVYNKGGTLRKRSAFKTDRKKAINSTGSTAGYRTADAKKAGLRPIEHSGEAYLYRLMKHNRDQSKAWFLRDLIDHYGFVSTKMGKNATAGRNLHAIPESWVPDDIRAAMSHVDDQVYLPNEMFDIYRNWEELTKMSNDQMTLLTRSLQNITTKFKTIVTLPLPGFHIRNMTFDFMMGVMDGVPTRTYGEVLAKFSKRNSTSFTIAPGISLSWNDLWHRFRENASSGGFYSVDLPPSNPFGRFKKIPGHMREMAELREDFGRFVHFLAAMRDEAGAIVRKGGKKNTDEVLNKAMEQAIFRVNHYKFDYGALTAFERKNLRLLFPFYTFSRKSIPMLTEAMFLSPKVLSRTYRFMDDPRDDAGDSIFNNVMVPAWMREIGYSQLGDEKEPWAISGDVMPTGPLNTIDWPFNTGTDPNTEDFAQSIMSQMNPFLTMPFEQAVSERIFDGRDPGSLTNQIGQMLRPVEAAKDLANPDVPFLQKLLSNPLLLGMGTRKITQEQQGYSEQDLLDQTVDDPFREFNYSQDKLRVYRTEVNGRMVFRVRNSQTGRTIYESENPDEALTYAAEHMPP